MKLTKQILKDMYKKMVLIRSFECKVAEMYKDGKIGGFLHTCQGQEAIAVGTCFNLTKEDYITSTHRGHGHVIAKGGDIRKMMAELFGKRDGYCNGKGGSMHIADLDLGILGANGIVGAGIPIATGAALACQKLYPGRVCVCFFGDGASNRGTFHESLNLASVWDLPVIFLIENNLYGMTISQKRQMKINDIAIRAAGYGMESEIIDGNDIKAIYTVVGNAIQRAREEGGPMLIECKTYRHGGHWVGDPCTYRAEGELEEWLKKDPIERAKKELLESGNLNKNENTAIWESANKKVLEAVEFAKKSPFPDKEEALENVYSAKIMEEAR